MMKLLLVALLSTFLIACVEPTSVKKSPSYSQAPPPHAPAHGYRHKHNAHNLIFDSGVGVYVVVGLKDYYFDNGRYYRYIKGIWEVGHSLEENGLWREEAGHVLPGKLYQSRAVKPHRNNGNNKGRGNEKKHH